MASMGLIRAEGNTATKLEETDKIVIQRFTDFTGKNNLWVPLETTISMLFGGSMILSVGQVTLAAGSGTVSLPAVTSTSKVIAMENSASPNALGVVVTAGTGFVIHSASGADTSVVNYVVFA